MTKNHEKSITGNQKKVMPSGLGGKRDGAGRKRVSIDWRTVEHLLASGASGAKVASAIGVHYDTLSRSCKTEKKIDFSDYAAKNRQKGDVNLYVKQYQVAMQGNTSMLIWLGKQRLGQSDKVEQKTENEVVVTRRAILTLPDNGRRFVKE